MVKRQNASTGEIVDDEQPASKAGRRTLRLKVQSPFKTYFDADVASVSAENATGPFDILPGHHRFITILKSGAIKIASPISGQQKILISGGLMIVKSDEATVFLDV